MPQMREPYEIDKTDDRFHSQTKDGEPQSSVEKAIALNYLWAVLGVWVAGLWLAIKTLKGNFHKKTFFYFFAISMPLAFMWGHYMHYLDPAYKGWNALPFQTIGKIAFWSIEDILFYTGCTLLYYCIFRLFHIRFAHWKDFKHANDVKVISWSLMVFGVAFFCFFGEECGQSLSFLYAIPGLLLMFYVWKEINSKLFIIFVILMVAFEVIWDWSMVSWIHYIPGMSWASGWFYISFGSDGTAYHSHVFMKYPFGWLFENPIEITPWYGIVGAFYPYMGILAIDKFRRQLKF